MSIQLVVRHTRAEEESGRAELVRAGVVGRRAPLTAALLLVGRWPTRRSPSSITAGLAGSGLAVVDSLALAPGIGLTGLVFGAVGGGHRAADGARPGGVRARRSPCWPPRRFVRGRRRRAAASAAARCPGSRRSPGPSRPAPSSTCGGGRCCCPLVLIAVLVAGRLPAGGERDVGAGLVAAPAGAGGGLRARCPGVGGLSAPAAAGRGARPGGWRLLLIGVVFGSLADDGGRHGRRQRAAAEAVGADRHRRPDRRLPRRRRRSTSALGGRRVRGRLRAARCGRGGRGPDRGACSRPRWTGAATSAAGLGVTVVRRGAAAGRRRARHRRWRRRRSAGTPALVAGQLGAPARRTCRPCWSLAGWPPPCWSCGSARCPRWPGLAVAWAVLVGPLRPAAAAAGLGAEAVAVRLGAARCRPSRSTPAPLVVLTLRGRLAWSRAALAGFRRRDVPTT